MLYSPVIIFVPVVPVTSTLVARPEGERARTRTTGYGTNVELHRAIRIERALPECCAK